VVVLEIEPGIFAGAPVRQPEQTVRRVWVGDERVEQGESLPFSVLDDVAASELLRDLDQLDGLAVGEGPQRR
jgi:hypothetical protein